MLSRLAALNSPSCPIWWLRGGNSLLRNNPSAKLFQFQITNSPVQITRDKCLHWIFKIRRNILQPKLRPRHPKNGLSLAKFGILGSSTLWLLKESILIAKCDRISHSRDKHGFGDQKHKSHDSPVDWTEFLEMLWNEKLCLIIAFGTALFVAILNIQIPLVLGKLVDVLTSPSITSEEFASKLQPYAFELIKLYAAQAVATAVYIFTLSVAAERMAHELRTKYFSSMMNQSLQFYDVTMTGEILGRLTNDVQEFKSCFKQTFSQGLRSISQSIGCVYSIYLISPGLSKVMIVFIPSVIVIGAGIGTLLKKMSRLAQGQISVTGALADECFSNIRVVKGFAMEQEEYRIYEQESEKLKVLNIELGGGVGIFQAGTNLFLNGIVLSILYFGGKKLTDHELSPGDLMAFMVASQTIQKSLTNLSQVSGTYIRGMESLARVQEYIHLDKGPRPGKRFNPSKLHGDVEFKNLSFSYSKRGGVLNNLNLVLPKGKVTALIGGSGSGKSTIVSLLQGLRTPCNGKVTINGINVQDISHEQLNSELIGVISQEPVLFATSIFENIRYGKPNATRDEVIRAARKANATDFIDGFPNGFCTVLGEKGLTVSGGQKQRIAIARAIIKDPQILILDEATSALDTQSENIIKEVLSEEMKGRTVLIIAHRLSTVQDADFIAVLSEGKIAEMGTHDELVAKKGLYYHLVKAQHIFFD